MKNRTLTARPSSNRYLLAGVAIMTALTLTRPDLLSKVFAAENQHEWLKQEDLDRLGGQYTSAAASADGSHLILGSTDGGENQGLTSPLYISDNYGSDWVNIADDIDAGIRNHWTSVDVSNDGQTMVATSEWGSDVNDYNDTHDGKVFVSEDGGDTWDNPTLVADGDNIWTIKSLAISDNGNKILIGGENGDLNQEPEAANTNLFMSANGGDTWTDISPDNNEPVYGLNADLSSDGNKIVVALDDDTDHVYVSSNSGTEWTEVAPEIEGNDTPFWIDSAMSDDGSTISVLNSGGNLHISNDFGATWSEEDPGQDYEDANDWVATDMNEDGTKMIVAGQQNAYLLGDTESEPEETTSTVSLTDPEGGKTVTLTTPDGTTITCHSAVKESGLSAKDAAYAYPLGLVDFCFSGAGASNDISLVFVTDLKPNQVVVRKYKPGSNQYSTVTEATVTETTYNNQHALRVTYPIVDNGPLDTDPDLGEVADPVGLGVADVSVPNTGFKSAR